MPNLCENRMSVLGDKNDTDAFRERHITEENEGLDFETVVKMPEILRNISTGKTIIDGEMYQQWVEDQNDGSDKRALTPEERLELDAVGYRSWYDWRVDHWGTKWNADPWHDTVTVKPRWNLLDLADLGFETTVGPQDAELFYCFDTACGPPMPIFETLAKLHPRLTFVINYEEVGMDFGGDMVFRSGGRTYDREYHPSEYRANEEDEHGDE
jgi:hypothetical protein